MTIELGKKYEARDGSVWRVVCVDNVPPQQPIVAVGQKGKMRTFEDNGKWWSKIYDSGNDLIREHVPAPELVAHYPIICQRKNCAGGLWGPLVANDDEARAECNREGYTFLRLATEYPAIMLPRKSK